MNRQSRSLALAAALLALAAPAAAQQAPAAARPLSLAEAIGVARENNPDYLKRRSDVAAAEADRRQALGAFLPVVSLDLRTNGYNSRTYTAFDPLGRPLAEDSAVVTERSSMTQSLSLGQLTLFDGGGRRREYRAARASEDAAQAAVAAEELRLAGEVARRYWKAVQQDRLIALEERLLDSAKESLEATRRLLRVAVRTPVDVLGAEVKVAEQEQALEKARGERRKAELDLRQQMGLLGSEPLALTDAPPAVFDASALDAEALVAGALAGSPRMARVEAALAAADQRVGAARAGRWPTLSANLGVSRDQSFTGYRGLYETNPRNQSLGFGFNLQLPLFNQFRTSNQIAQARARRLGAEVDARAERLAVERDVRAALIDLQNAHRAVQGAERTVGLARERLELARQQYQLGSLSFSELQDAVEGAARAERDALGTRFDFAAALATLEEKAGGPVGPRP